jgi:hypothetical protein
MGSPFPGMDPWLEAYWRGFHARLIIYIADQLQGQLPEPLVARPEEDVLVDAEDAPPASLRPDVGVVEVWGGTASSQGQSQSPTAPAAVAEPVVVRVPEPEVHRRIEIIDPTSGEKVITAIEVLSPSNKLPGRAREAYKSKQRDFLAAGVNVVEIDLVREGAWVFSADQALLPTRKRMPYMVCVFRATRPSERAFYLLPLRERLPRIALPLRPQDRDVVLDLQQVVDETYERVATTAPIIIFPSIRHCHPKMPPGPPTC